MPPIALPPAFRPGSSRAFTTTSAPRASVLFALNSLSNSRETQHLNKLSRLNRVEHSPPLKLIQQSEVDTHPLPTPSPAEAQAAAQNPLAATPADSHPPAVLTAPDEHALHVGRAVLAQHATDLAHLRQALTAAQNTLTQTQTAQETERLAWERERARTRGEMRQAGVLILLSIGAATGLATWRFWPGGHAQAGGVGDSGEMGRRIAAGAQKGVAVPPVGSGAAAAAKAKEGGVRAIETMVGENAAAAPAVASPLKATVAVPAAEPALAGTASVGMGLADEGTSRESWWKGLFWKQQ